MVWGEEPVPTEEPDSNVGVPTEKSGIGYRPTRSAFVPKFLDWREDVVRGDENNYVVNHNGVTVEVNITPSTADSTPEFMDYETVITYLKRGMTPLAINLLERAGIEYEHKKLSQNKGELIFEANGKTYHLKYDKSKQIAFFNNMRSLILPDILATFQALRAGSQVQLGNDDDDVEPESDEDVDVEQESAPTNEPEVESEPESAPVTPDEEDPVDETPTEEPPVDQSASADWETPLDGSGTGTGSKITATIEDPSVFEW